ncbi:hypothetical protein SFOMI_3217 [Sphingobium fuliginis]|uniref:Uncharacterized protein n=1 Tax=Sphingobium fuliginis (strain ATCC 27551) TaxID=336203 RepID=A0A292ZHU2_SPHSA|nr:hypothetical protein SFOMI_3217 [Sphingobium fuliginis]
MTRRFRPIPPVPCAKRSRSPGDPGDGSRTPEGSARAGFERLI